MWVLQQWATAVPWFDWIHFWSRSFTFDVVSEELHRVVSLFSAPAPPTGYGWLAHLVYRRRAERAALLWVARRLRRRPGTVYAWLKLGRRLAPELSIAIWDRSLCFRLMVNVRRLGLRPPLSEYGQERLLVLAAELRKDLDSEPVPAPLEIPLSNGRQFLRVKLL